MPEGIAHPELERLDRLARAMDRAVRLPVIGVRVGWDSLLGLIPGIGDVLTLGPAAYIVLKGHQMGVPAHVTLRMLGNVGLDALIGSIPLVGDLFDIGWKANTRNVALLSKHVSPPVPDDVADAPPIIL
ncbi:DUF4112 domain-containing protein [uncultured Tateyamaria sp.]|uniref:DUF4112 domain-containing protein n=1 Tax=uncultured Tateyamaria sp. TaxID=455651 RepID=UPI002604E9DA|nr:DUF4112 domain-containing protein [uncultured Tateyamaria sp.]